MRLRTYTRVRMRDVLLTVDVDNPGLVALVADAARAAALDVVGGLPRRDAARLCWEYIRHHTTYLEETNPFEQLPRMPWRFVKDGVGDCKSQAIYTAALCAASGCRVFLRFVTMAGDTEPGHVYTIVDNIPVDPLLPFGTECPYIASLDIPIPTR